MVEGLEWCWLISISIIILFTMIFALLLGGNIGVEALAFIFGIQWDIVVTSGDLILVLFCCTFVAIICTPFTLFISYIVSFPLIKITAIFFPNALVEKDVS